MKPTTTTTKASATRKKSRKRERKIAPTAIIHTTATHMTTTTTPNPIEVHVEGHARDPATGDVVVLKGHPFTGHLRIAGASGCDLSRATVTADLIYDCAGGSLRPVSFASRRPLEFFGVPGCGATKLELRVMVLSSQHENALFRIRVTVIDTAEMASFVALSAPIRCVSKLSHATAEGSGSGSSSSSARHKRRRAASATKQSKRHETVSSPCTCAAAAQAAGVDVLGAPEEDAAAGEEKIACSPGAAIAHCPMAADAVGRLVDQLAEAMRGEDGPEVLRHAVEARLAANPARFLELSRTALSLHAAVFPLDFAQESAQQISPAPMPVPVPVPSEAASPPPLALPADFDPFEQQQQAMFGTSSCGSEDYFAQLEDPLTW